MPTNHRAELAKIKRFDQLVAYLRDEMDWPIERDDFEELTFDYSPEELGIDPKNAAKIQEIKRLRPLSAHQPWGIFFVKFEPKRLPVVALRRILSQVAVKKRASANKSERQAWAADDLLFISNYGQNEERQISFAHFSQDKEGKDLPTLKVLGWNNLDTALHLDAVARDLTDKLVWPEDEADSKSWRDRWRSAFTLRHGEVITTSKQLSIRLAELARAIRDRINTTLAIETEKGPLTRLMKAFQTALIHDLDAEGFADMYAQTIAYGLLSARIADPARKTVDDFAAHMRTNPFLRELMETFLKVGGRCGKAGGPGIDFDELGVSEVVELLDNANMEAVVRDFGDRNPQEDPVIHFYEGFAKEYDPIDKLRRGEFYTPRPVVSYIVRSVDELLRTEFGLADGLADTTTWGEMAKCYKDLKIPEGVSHDQDFVQILDPATGTGTFLVEVIDVIYKTLVAKWNAQGHSEKKINVLWNEYVPKHLLTRLHAYEIKMAPYAIAHLKIGLKLYETGYRFGSDERARVYLTNALEPAQDFSGRFEFAIPAIAHEAKAVTHIKRTHRFTVTVGNPPYSAISANLTPTLREIVSPYRYVDGVVIREKGALQFEKNLNDDYVKFIRFTESCIEQHVGVLGLITNNAYLESATLRGLRSHLLEVFSRLWFLDLHGDSDKREKMVNGKPDENVFEIKHGVAIALLVRHPCPEAEQGRKGSMYRFNLKETRLSKYGWLLNHTSATTPWTRLAPRPDRYIFAEEDIALASEYERFDSIRDLLDVNSTGFESGRDEILTAFTKEELRAKILAFASKPAAEIREEFSVAEGWGAVLFEGRKAITTDPGFELRFREFLFSPFDVRWCFYRKDLLKTNSFSAGKHLCYGKNHAVIVMRQVSIDAGFSHVGVSRIIVNNRCFYSTKGKVSYFPVRLFSGEDDLVRKTGDDLGSNFRPGRRDQWAKSLGLRWMEDESDHIRYQRALTASDAAAYAYAILYSPGYRNRYAEFLKSDFPRLPLTKSLDLFSKLAILGSELTALHLLESPKLAKPITEYLGGRAPKVEKVSWSKNTVWIDKAQSAGFKGVREEVWNFHIGGYQVCKKWLDDRRKAERKLSKDDIAHYQKIVVALSETIRIMKRIDEVIEEHGGWPGAFQTGEAALSKVIPFQPRTIEPKPSERYVTCVPLVPLKAAAGAFSDPQNIEENGFEWVAVESHHRLRPGMFVAQVVGKSMEPVIPNGAYCLFRAPVEGTRQGKTVLVQLRDTRDPESGERYTVKRYESEKAQEGQLWRHDTIILKPVNPDFKPIVLSDAGEGDLKVIAELVEVL